jgi:hypothetical protein
MAKKRIDIPDDMTSRLAGASNYPPSVFTPNFAPAFVPQAPQAEPTPQKNLGGRPVKESSVGRIKYTTALSKEMIRFLRVEAAQRDITPADLLDIILGEYQNKLKED